MDETIKAIQTRDGPKQIDYNALANKPEIPSLAPYRTAAAQDVIDAGKIDTDMSVTAAGLPSGSTPTVSYDVANNRLDFGIPAGGVSTWTELQNKPFETLGGTLQVENGVLNIVIPPEYGRVSYNGFELTIE